VDASGATWTLSGGVVNKNGSAAGYSSGVVDLVYMNGGIYQENAANNWYMWNGSTWIASPYSPLVATAGVCGGIANVCTIGNLANSADNGTYTTWSCTGIDGGTTASCSIHDPVINGTCGTAAKSCSQGTASNIADNGTTTTWSCIGGAGGTTAVCNSIDVASNTASAKLGINLGFFNDWGDREMMFVDVVKNARGFMSATPGQVGSGQVAVDANGWPTSDFGAIFLSDPADFLDRPVSETFPSFAGTYNFSFTGQATVNSFACCQIQNVSYNAATNTTTGQVVVSPTDTFLALTFTGTNNGIQNLHLLRPGYPLGTTQIFTTQFLNAIAPFSTLRFMDPLVTNASTVTSWSQRTLPTSPSQAAAGTGIAWEYVIALANASGKDIWINIPEGVNLTDTTSNNYVTQLANLLHANLNPGIHVYVEYSNELWNYAFQQTSDNLSAAISDVDSGADPTLNYDNGNNQYYWASRRVVHQIVRISQLFKNVYGAAAINTTIRPVYLSQFVQPFLAEDGLNYLYANFGAPNQYIYGIGGAPYYGTSGSGYSDVPSFIAALQTGLLTIESDFPTETYSGGIQYGNVSYKGLADYWGLKSLSYEGGPAPDYGSSNVLNEEVLSDPGENQTIQSELANWYGCGNDLFMYFDLAEAQGNFWGAYEDLSLPTPKSTALQAVSQTPLSSYTTCLSH